MSTNDYIVKDSSIYRDAKSFNLENYKDCSVKIGIVRDIVNIKDVDIAYIVEVWLNSKYTPVQCVRTSRFGGVYNYEEYNYRGFNPGEDVSADGLLDYKAGDVVIIAYVDGDSRDGVILGCLNHPGRQRKIAAEDSICYFSEFNGLEKTINDVGEYSVTYKGTATNIDILSNPVDGQPIPEPEYDESVAGSYYRFTADGSYELSDNADQVIQIDKSGGNIFIVSGNTELAINKEEQTYSITNKKTTFASAEEFNVKTKKTNFDSTDLFNVKAKDIKTDGKWTQKGDVEITGTTTNNGDMTVNGAFTTTGQTSLAGGAHALVYDIVLTKGTGNKGAPVISNLTILKTAQTKAT